MVPPGCVLCPVYRPRARPRLPETPPVCYVDRRLLERQLTEVTEWYARLARPEPVAAPRPRDRRADNTGGPPADPLGPMGGAGPVPGRSGQPRVSGSRRLSSPVSVDRVDLTLPARPATRRLLARGVLGIDQDQTGHLSVATILDSWVRDWRDTCWPELHRPPATVPELVRWLRNRVDGACTAHPAIADFAAEIQDVRAALRRLLGEGAPPRETRRYRGVACPECDLRGVLARHPGDDYVECGACGILLTETELGAE